MASAAATAGTCGYGNGGPDATTICWLDLSGYDEATVEGGGQPFSFPVDGGLYTLSFSLTPVTSSPDLEPVAAPTSGGSYVGNQVYTATPGEPALEQQAAGETSNFTLNDVALTDTATGDPVSGYAIVAADAGITTSGETAEFLSAAGGLSNISGPETGYPICGGGLTSIPGRAFECRGAAEMQYGALVVQASNATHLQVILSGSASGPPLAVALGVELPRVSVTARVAGRAYPTDSFTVAAGDASGSPLASATTGSSATATTGPVSVLAGSDETLTQSGASGTGTSLSNYQTSWSCLDNGVAYPVTPSADGTSVAITPALGDDIACTVTDVPFVSIAPIPAGAGEVGAAYSGPIPTPTPAAGPYTWSATGLPPGLSIDPSTGAITGTPAAAGTYTVTVVATNPDGRTGSQTTTITVTPAPTITLSPPPASEVGTTYSEPAPTVTGGTAPYAYTASGLPAGLSIDPSTGVIAGTPTVPGTYQVTVTVTDGDGEVASAVETIVVKAAPPPPEPRVSLVKKATVSPIADQGGVKVGDTIAYTYTVTNAGNVTLGRVAVDDPNIGAVTCPVPAAPGLAPGASETCAANRTHTVTQADVDAGQVTDTATATGTDTQGKVSRVSPPSTVTVPAAPARPGVSVVKRATVSPASDQRAAKAGDAITYTFTVTNTGNVTLKSVAVDDPTGGPVDCPTPPPPGLAPGASETCTGTTPHVVTAADVAAGNVTDTATATGTDTRGRISPPSAPSTATVTTATVTTAAVATAPTTPPSSGSPSSARSPSSPEQALTSIVTGHGLWSPGGPTGTLYALTGSILVLLGGLGLVGLRRRRRSALG